MDNQSNIDSLISSIVKTSDELAEENKHCWHTQPPPIICFQNCFSKSFASDWHNWKNVYPEWYWADQRYKQIKRKIQKHQYKNNAELADIEQQLSVYYKRLSTVRMNPRKIYFTTEK